NQQVILCAGIVPWRGAVANKTATAEVENAGAENSLRGFLDIRCYQFILRRISGSRFPWRAPHFRAADRRGRFHSCGIGGYQAGPRARPMTTRRFPPPCGISAETLSGHYSSLILQRLDAEDWRDDVGPYQIAAQQHRE